MGWDQLSEIAREREQHLLTEIVDRPMVCPHDGEPLTDKDGTLYCRFDGVIHLFELDL